VETTDNTPNYHPNHNHLDYAIKQKISQSLKQRWSRINMVTKNADSNQLDEIITKSIRNEIDNLIHEN
jgi:hypothetical protein